MTKKKDPKDLKKVGRIPEVLKRFGYSTEKDYKAVLKLIEDKIEEELTLKGDLATITGLILVLGYSSKTSFYDDCQLKNYPELSSIIKRARIKVESTYEECLKKNSPTGAIFALKNMGWSDRQVIESELNDDEKKRLFD